jgi:hypothetical protein
MEIVVDTSIRKYNVYTNNINNTLTRNKRIWSKDEHNIVFTWKLLRTLGLEHTTQYWSIDNPYIDRHNREHRML